MRSSTITLALSLLAAAASVSGTYTNGNDFLDDLPTCIKDCNADTIAALKKQCDSASNNLECVCTASDSMNASSSDAACTLACSEDDQNDLIKVSLEMATSCVPYLAGENENNNSTMSSMSGMTTATGSSVAASSTGGSMTTTTTTSTSNSTTNTSTATETPSSTASNSPAQAGAAAGRAAWAGSLLVAVPAAMLAGMIM